MIRILTLCTGNVCRSPLAEQLLRARLDPIHFEIASAGISALVDDQMPRETQQIARRLGLEDAAAHRAVSISADMIAAADLIFAMDRQHRAAAVQTYAPAIRHTFTLTEFAHITTRISDEDLPLLIPNDRDIYAAALAPVQRLRGAVPRLWPDFLYDIEDPYGRSTQAYERSAQEIETAVDQIVGYFQRVLPMSAVSSRAVDGTAHRDLPWQYPVASLTDTTK